MTIASQTTAETMLGDGSNRKFPFTFQAWEGEVRVVVTAPDDRAEDVTPLAAVTLAKGDTPGGLVTYPAAAKADPLPAGWKLTVLRDMDFLQTVRLVNATRYDPLVIERALDRLAATCQQLREQADRAAHIPVGANVTADDLLGIIYEARAQCLAAIEELAGMLAEAENGLEQKTTETATALETALQTVRGELDDLLRRAEDAAQSALAAAGLPDASAATAGDVMTAVPDGNNQLMPVWKPAGGQGSGALASPAQNGLAPAGGAPGQVYRVNALGTAYAWEDLKNVATPTAAAATPGIGYVATAEEIAARQTAASRNGAPAFVTPELLPDGSGNAGAGTDPGFTTRRLFTTSQTFIAPRSGVYLFNLTGAGGGGGGGGTYVALVGGTMSYGGASGGAGGTHQYAVQVAEGATISMAVGAAGAGGGANAGGKGGGATTVTIGSQTYRAGGGGGGGGSYAANNSAKPGGNGGAGGPAGGSGENGGTASSTSGGAGGAGGTSNYPTLSTDGTSSAGGYCTNTYGYGHGGKGGQTGSAGKSGCIELIY